MARTNDILRAALNNPPATPVYYLASTERGILEDTADTVRAALFAHGAGEGAVRIDGPAPDIGAVVAAAGALSLLGDVRVVEIREVSPAAMKDADARDLAELFGEVQSAVLLITALYKDRKAAESKKAKLLFGAAEKSGVALELAKPTRRDNIEFIEACAQSEGARFAPRAADTLLERVGDDRPLLRRETAKLAAACGYGTIGADLVPRLCARNVEADVFELVRLITAGGRRAAFMKLAELISLRHEPIAITAALAGSYTDMARVLWGAQSGRGVAQVFADFGYRGSDWRLQKAKESAAAYGAKGIAACVLCLEQLDAELKRSALPDKTVLLQAAVARLLSLRRYP